MFCHVRNIALRVNRANIRVKIRPFEILSQVDQYKSVSLGLSSMLSETFELLQAYESTFENYCFKTIVCNICETMHNLLDKDRNEIAERKTMPNMSDKRRDQTAERKTLHNLLDKDGDQKYDRKKMHNRL